MRLNEIKDNDGAHKRFRRVGRGIGSGKGKTSGRGVKGQKARTGVSINGYEGGQMPIFRRMPKRGFNPLNPKNYQTFNVGDLQDMIDAKRIDASKPISAASLKEAGVIKSLKDGLKILGQGSIKSAVTIEVAGISQTAKAAIEKAGGKVTVIAKKKNAADVAKAEKSAKKKAKPAPQKPASAE